MILSGWTSLPAQNEKKKKKDIEWLGVPSYSKIWNG